ncbi:hypothetical protein DFH06DRAFT_1350223 [Mycena polygramma]|nr:hypothetical protein DFH06DRAFT_1350223 [Mycena polygramma]
MAKRQRARVPKSKRRNLKMWAEGARESILTPHIEPYADSMERGWRYEREYFQQDHEEPVLPLEKFDPNAPLPELERLPEAEERRRQTRMDQLNARIRRWFKYRVKRLRKHVRTKARQGFQQYMREMYEKADNDIEALVKEKWAATPSDGSSVATSAQPNAPFRAKVDEYKARAKAEAVLAREKFDKALNDPPGNSPHARQTAIDALGTFVAPILQGIFERTGLHCCLLLGGPIPKYGGDLRTIHIIVWSKPSEDSNDSNDSFLRRGGIRRRGRASAEESRGTAKAKPAAKTKMSAASKGKDKVVAAAKTPRDLETSARWSTGLQRDKEQWRKEDAAAKKGGAPPANKKTSAKRKAGDGSTEQEQSRKSRRLEDAAGPRADENTPPAGTSAGTSTALRPQRHARVERAGCGVCARSPPLLRARRRAPSSAAGPLLLRTSTSTTPASVPNAQDTAPAPPAATASSTVPAPVISGGPAPAANVNVNDPASVPNAQDTAPAPPAATASSTVPAPVISGGPAPAANVNVNDPASVPNAQDTAPAPPRRHCFEHGARARYQRRARSRFERQRPRSRFERQRRRSRFERAGAVTGGAISAITNKPPARRRFKHDSSGAAAPSPPFPARVPHPLLTTLGALSLLQVLLWALISCSHRPRLPQTTPPAPPVHPARRQAQPTPSLSTTNDLSASAPAAASSAPPPPFQFTEDAPKWLRESVRVLSHVDLGCHYRSLVEALIRVEDKFGGSSALDPSGARNQAEKPYNARIKDLGEYGGRWWTWWDSLQPEWRKRGADKVWEISDGYSKEWEWDPFWFPGQNGLALGGTGVWDETNRKSWERAVGDAAWVLEGLEQALPPRKRKRVRV